MALQVWLPLNSDTMNLGLNGREAHTVGTVTYASGLLGGKCFNSGEASIEMPIGSVPVEMTISVWFRLPGSASNGTLVAFGGLGDRLEYFSISRSLSWQNEGIGMLPDGTTLGTVQEGKWHNLVITADGTNVIPYLDGVAMITGAQEDTIVDAFGSDATIYIGAKADGTGRLSGYIQDFKMYDRILSKKEILDLSKGLMLEYTFNHNGFGNENILVRSETGFDFQLDSQEIITRVEVSSKEYIENAPRAINLEPGVYTISALTSGFWAGADEDYNSGAVITGDPADIPVRLELYTFDSDPNVDEIDSRMLISLGSKGSAAVTITTQNTYLVGVVAYGDGMTGGQVTVDAIKLEKGTIATPWLPHKGSPMYEAMQIGTVEQDTSGNCHDGDISTNPEVDWSSDSAVFSGSYDFSEGGYVETPILDFSNIDSAEYHLGNLTFAFWAKAHAIADKVFFGLESESQFALFCKEGVFSVRHYYQDFAFLNNGSTISVNDYLDAWHHYAIVLRNASQIVDLYIDGELAGSVDNGFNDQNGPSKVMINGVPGIVNKVNGLMSDFRIYAKELTAEDIAALCHSKAAVDKNGRVFGMEFIAGASGDTRLVNRRGVVKSNELTTFDTPITPETEEAELDEASVFKFGKDKIVATEVIES